MAMLNSITDLAIQVCRVSELWEMNTISDINFSSILQ